MYKMQYNIFFFFFSSFVVTLDGVQYEMLSAYMDP